MSVFTHRPVPAAANQRFLENPTRDNPHPVFGNYQDAGHLAADYPAALNDPVAAPAAGVVVYAGPGELMPAAIANRWGYHTGAAGWASGNITIIDHGGGLGSAISHLAKCQTRAGQTVHGGQQIGLAGATGRSTGVHVHLEAIRLPVDYASALYSRVDPEALFGAASTTPARTTPAEEDDMPGFSENVIHDQDGNRTSVEKVLNSIDRKQDQQGKVLSQLVSLTGSILATRLPDPSDPKQSYSIADYIVWGATNAKTAAGSAAQSTRNTSPAALAAALAAAITATDAAAGDAATATATDAG